MAQPDLPRRKADELLLLRGPLPVERVLLEIAEYVMPGDAARLAVRHHKTAEDDELYASRKGDPTAVGKRTRARQVMGNAVRYGVWLREGDMIRHRDWAAPAEAPVPGFVIPTMDVIGAGLDLGRYTAWHWAAIIAAHVDPSEGPGRPAVNGKSANYMSPGEFAGLGINGLSSPHTVRRYWRIWMDEHGSRPNVGEAVAIPDKKFPTVTGTPADVRAPDARGRRGGFNTSSNDPAEWNAFLAANKTPEFIAQHALLTAQLAARKAEPSRTRRRSRGGNVIPIRKGAVS